MRRPLLTLLLLVVAPTAVAWNPHFDPQSVVLSVGETATVEVTAVPLPWGASIPRRTWVFHSSNAKVIAVAGSLTAASFSSRMRITGLQPGKAKAVIASMDPDLFSVNVTVRCAAEPDIQPAEALQKTKIGVPVTLRAVTPIADRTTFTWYHGMAGDLSAPIAASGPEIAFATNDAGKHHVWVMATTPCSTSMAQFEIEALAPKRRGARH